MDETTRTSDLDTSIVSEIWSQITNYVSSLDWAYIITFIIIAYGINNNMVKARIKKVTKVRSKTRYRVAFIGLLYAMALYFIRDYSIAKVERLFQSFVFAIVFHKFIIEGLTKYIGKRILAPEIEAQSLAEDYSDRFNTDENE